MRTGELARQAGVNLQTIRFYEREHLLAEPSRTESGYRRYTQQDLERVVFIKACQQVGFTLKDIHSLAELHGRLASAPTGRTGIAERRKIAAIAEDRLRQIDEKLRQLTEMRNQLLAVRAISLPDSVPRCPVAHVKAGS